MTLCCGGLCGCGDHAPAAPPAAPAPTGPPIFDLLSLMGKTPRQVKQMLHLSYLSEQYRMEPGDPNPGELNMVFLHSKGKFPEMDVAFDGNNRCHFVMYHEIESYGYAFDQYVPLLARLGIPIDAPPDIEAPEAHNWKNWRGYQVHVFGHGPPDRIWQAQVATADQ